MQLIQEDTQTVQKLFEKGLMLLEQMMEQEHGQMILSQSSRSQI